MTNKEEPSKYHTVQAERDLEANWEVDLAKKLEDYLLKICSGEITGNEEDNSVNFAEAALLLQGSVQVYSRKVEYLYNLVLHALDFLSHKRQQEQAEDASVQHEQCGSHTVSDEENDHFWVLDDIPVEPRNSLDTSTSKDASFYQFVKPPANLVVLEGDCLDTGGDGGELESYLLATSDLYQDFILLDPCDAVAINDFLGVDDTGKGQNGASRGSSVRKTFLSPTRCSGGTAHKSSLGKNQDANLMQSPMAGCSFGVNYCKMEPDPPVYDDFEDNKHGFDMGDKYSERGNPEDSDDDDDDDPWKPLNPHEPGNLKVKPFKKVKAFRRNGVKSGKQISIATLFPLARIHGTIDPDLCEMWEIRKRKLGRCENLQSPPLYEKLRESLTNGGHNIPDPSGNSENDNEDNIYDAGIPDFGWPDDEMPEATQRDDDLPHAHEKHDEGSSQFGPNDDFEHVDPSSQASLEDLCRAHLDALLANIAETEKQTELVARVSTWKQKIEQNLEEQDSHPPFDIHAYGESIVHKLSLEADGENTMSFTDVVCGQEKHDVARTFSALLQLVNNGEVDLDQSRAYGESYCYTAVNTFHVRLLSHKKKQEGTQINLSKKRVKSSKRRGSPKLGKNGGIRCTPEGKRRRRSQLVEAVDLNSAG